LLSKQESSGRFHRAIVRPPPANFTAGLTTVDLGTPNYQLALQQHQAYSATLERCGLKLILLDADERYPDSTFVEDTAVLTEQCTIVTRPGAPSRTGEVESIDAELAKFYPARHTIREPGTLDGGDVCDAGDHFFIGISQRTNESGAQQLAEILAAVGYSSTSVDIREVGGILHLKSGLAYLGDRRFVVIDSLAEHEAFRGYELIQVNRHEQYAANCIVVNDYVLIAGGFPVLEKNLRALGQQTIAVDMSEFQKMDGGLSCLSLRF
jgi:dimethylargininase